MIVEHSFDVWIVHIRRIRFELCLMEKKKKKKKKKKEKRRRTKSKFSHSIFSTVGRSHGTLGGVFDIRIAKGFHL